MLKVYLKLLSEFKLLAECSLAFHYGTHHLNIGCDFIEQYTYNPKDCHPYQVCKVVGYYWIFFDFVPDYEFMWTMACQGLSGLVSFESFELLGVVRV